MTYTKTILSSFDFPKIFWKSLMLFFFLYSTETLYAQTVIIGMQYITITDDALIHIQNDKEADYSESGKMTSNLESEKYITKNETIASKKPYSKRKLFKNQVRSAQLSKDKTADNTHDQKDIKISGSPYNNDYSFSVSSGKSLLACSVDSQWRTANITEKTYFILYHVLDVSHIFRNNSISFPDNTSSYYSGRAPPSC